MSNRFKTYDPKFYNHAFDLAFCVTGSYHEDGWDCLMDPKEKGKVKAALMKRVYDMFNQTNEYREAMDCFDTYCENDHD